MTEDPTIKPCLTDSLAGEPEASSFPSPAQTLYVKELFEQHRLALYRYLKRVLVSRDDAQEMLQETYVRILRQPSLDRLKQNARAYLFQTAANLANDHFRSRSLKSAQVEADLFAASGLGSPDWASWPEHALQGEQTKTVLMKALHDLPAPVRIAILQDRFQELTHAEIAMRMGVSERTVERYIKKGLSLIADRLEAHS
jgi:RNA polymerase sigma-70 factor (ECF subfamily)